MALGTLLKKKLLKLTQPEVLSTLQNTAAGLSIVRGGLGAIVEGFLNKALARLPGYQGSVESIGMRLIGGRIELTNLVVNKKVTREKAEPFIAIPKISLSLHWKDLLFKRVVGDITIESPRIMIDARRWSHPGPARPTDERRRDADLTWQGKLRKALPFRIDTLSIRHGSITVSHIPGQDDEEMMLSDMDVRVYHLTNSDTLAATLATRADLNCKVLSEGSLECHGEGYPLELLPTFKAGLTLRGVRLPKLGNIIRDFLDVDVIEGEFEAFVEAEGQGGRLKGYAKQIFDHLRIQSVRRPGVLRRIKTWMAQGLLRLLRNKEKDRIATRFNFEGSFKDPHIDIAGAMVNFIRNSFGAVFRANLEPRMLHLFRARPAEAEVDYPPKVGRAGRLWSLIKESFSRWLADDVPRMSAALSYFTCFSLAPLLLMLIALIGLFFGRNAAQGHILRQLTALVGKQSAQTIQTMIAAAWQPSKGITATVISAVTLLVGAFGVLSELKTGLNRIMKTSESGGLGGIVLDRAKYLGFILGIGFLLIVSLAVSGALEALGQSMAQVLPLPKLVLQAIDFALSIGVITVLFASIFRFLPNRRLPWRPIWLGGAFTAAFFTFGKYGLALYLGRETTASAYGAAGSILIVLLWVYYSSLILYYGAEVTNVYAEKVAAQPG